MKRLAQIILAAFIVLAGGPASAQDGAESEAAPLAKSGSSLSEAEVSRTTMEVSNEVMSPFCPGKTLAMCPSPAAAEVRRDIQVMASQGDDTETIKRKLIEEYGDEFEIIEPDRFDNMVVLTLIIFGLLLCLAVVLLISKRAGSRRDDDDSDGDADGDDGKRGGDDDDDDGPGDSPLSGAEDGEVDDPYLKALRDEYRS